MTSLMYLDILKENRVNPLSYYSGGKHSKSSRIYAVIMSTKEIKQPVSSTHDSSMTFYITDPSIVGGSIAVNMFDKDISNLESVKKSSIIIIQNFFVKLFNGRHQITINRFTKFASFTVNPLTLIKNINYEFTPVDNVIITALEDCIKQFKQLIEESAAFRLPTKRPLLETFELDENESKFFDYVGEVLNVFMQDNRAVLSLTDYTLNPLPIRYNIDENVVKKEYIIKCTAWDTLSEKCSHLQPGDYVSLCNCVKKDYNPLEFAIRSVNNERKELILKIEEDDRRLKKLIERKKNYGVSTSLKRVSYDEYPLSTEIYNLPRKFISIKAIKLETEPSRFQTQARIVRYEPEEIDKWIRGWCDHCALSSEGGTPCKNCNASTIPIYKLSLILKDNSNEELKVEAFQKSAEDLFFQVPAALVLTDENTKERLKAIITLATEKENYFEFGLHSERYKNGLIYQFMKTRFIYEEDELDE